MVGSTRKVQSSYEAKAVQGEKVICSVVRERSQKCRLGKTMVMNLKTRYNSDKRDLPFRKMRKDGKLHLKIYSFAEIKETT
jgi:hypothetical protein